MALMSKIRDNLSKLFAGLAVFFIIFIVFDWGMDLGSQSGQGNYDVIGEVNGVEISSRQFSELVRRAADQQKQQTGVDVDEETERQLRSQVWNQLVEETLIDQEIERLGITVSDQEIVDLLQSPNPPEFLMNQFRDSTGAFVQEAYYRAMADPQNKASWLQIEDALRYEQRRKKLQTLIFAAARVTEGDVRERYTDRNVTLDAEFVLFDANRMVHDTAVTVTDEDMRRYLELHPEDHQVKAGRKLKYVTFNQAASREDSLAVRAELEGFLAEVRSGVDFLELLNTYSEIPITDAYFKHGELSREKELAVFSAKKGEVVGPIQDFDGFHLIKILDERRGKDEFVRASHILINIPAGPDSAKALQQARDIARQARGGADFARLAVQHSQDFGSAQHGGDLGFGGRGTWVKTFEDAAFRAAVGEVAGPVRSQFGWHIIKVTAKDRRELKLADLAMKVKPSPKTIDDAVQQASDFAYLANEEGFEKAAEVAGYQVRETPEFTKGALIPGIGFNDAVTSFAFKQKVGRISEPLSVTNGIGVFTVSHIRTEGVRPFDEAKPTLRVAVLREKKMAILKPEVTRFHASLTPESDLPAFAASLPNVQAQRTGPFKPLEFPAGVGRDPRFIGTALALNPGEISQPFEGVRGYYIIKLASKTEVDSAQLAAQRTLLREQILQEKRARLLTEWRTALRDKADIEDYRDRFYR